MGRYYTMRQAINLTVLGIPFSIAWCVALSYIFPPIACIIYTIGAIGMNYIEWMNTPKLTSTKKQRVMDIGFLAPTLMLLWPFAIPGAIEEIRFGSFRWR